MRRAKTFAIEGAAVAIVAIVLLLSYAGVLEPWGRSGDRRTTPGAPVFLPPPPPVPPPPVSSFERALWAHLDPDGDVDATRRDLDRMRDAQLAEGRDPLAQMDALRASVHRARAFAQPPFAKRPLPRTVEWHEEGSTLSFSSDLRLTLALPPSYVPADPRRMRDAPATPLIVTLHEERDFQNEKGATKFPGESVIARRFAADGPSSDVLAEWAVLAPVTSKGRWTPDPSLLDFRPVLEPLRAVWERYDVDFDRFVIDGGSEALTFAAARPHFFAGAIVRGDAADLDPDLVGNLAGMRVYVVGTPASAAVRTLLSRGHPADRLEVGGPDGLARWLKTVRRVLPRAFHWTMKDHGMSLAHWVTITTTEPNGVPTMDVEVVDTPADPNTIRIRTQDVRGLVMLLCDDVVDLDREVRVVINGEPLQGAQVRGEGEIVRLPARLSRSLTTMFTAPPLDVRKNLAYGMLFPVILDGIRVLN